MLPVKNDKTEATARAGLLGRALERFKAVKAGRERITRVAFLIDATGSRAAAWAEAQQVQARMFHSVAGLGRFALRLVHFGGREVIDHGWMESALDVAGAMSTVQCVQGYTQFVPALRGLLDDEPAQAIIIVGDSYEESYSQLAALGDEMAGAGIKVFAFLDGEDAEAAQEFRRLAGRTGGRFARFGDDMPLRDLCEGVSLLLAGGASAVRRLGNENVKRLLLAGPSGK